MSIKSVVVVFLPEFTGGWRRVLSLKDRRVAYECDTFKKMVEKAEM